MPNLPISQLPAAGSLTGAELFAVVQSGVTKYTTLQAVNTSLSSNYGLFSSTGSSAPVTGSGDGTITSGSLLNGGVGTLSVPANGFKQGDAFAAILSGRITVANNHDFEVQVRSDNVILADTGIFELAQATNRNWRLDLNFSIQEIGPAGIASIATSGMFHYRTDSAGDVKGEIFSFVNSSSFDTTINNTLKINAVWGTDGAITDSIFSQICTLNKTF